MISTVDFRSGVRLMVEGEPFYIVDFQHVKPGKGGAFVRTKLKSYLSGNVLDRTFRSGERFEEPDLEDVFVWYSRMKQVRHGVDEDPSRRAPPQWQF